MYAIEFQAQVHDGRIEIPAQYHEQLRQRVRVILLLDDRVQTPENFVEELLAHPIQVGDFQPLTREEIYV